MATRAEERQRSVTISLFFHFLLFLFLFFYRIEPQTEIQEFIEIGFGGDGASMLSGVPDKLNDNPEDVKQNTELEKNDDVNLPKAGESPEDPSVKKETEKKPEENKNTNNSQNTNTQTSGSGSTGYDIDWGGMGQRKIYSFILPAYPEGVNKNIDIRIRFTILPDGTVGSVLLLVKADTRLENAAITSLRQWRFEPLPAKQNQVVQNAVITFPYRVQ
ncbi:MAG: TonB family protein [Ignavibacteriaceae bacterium]|nr:TonB family protein [Ignavibacteriaceae bacterium]